MFDGVSFCDNTLLFHSSPSANQAGASTTLRQATLVFSRDTVSIASYGPFALPLEVRDAKEFQRLLVLNDNSIRVTGTSKQVRRRPDWPMLTYAYRLYAKHSGISEDGELPPWFAHMVKAKRSLWNAMCDLCEQAIDRGQIIATEVLDSIAADVTATLRAFNDSVGHPKDKLPFPKNDGNQIPARRVGAYLRFVAHLKHLAKEGKPIPNGLAERLDAVFNQYPYDWKHFGEFERSVLSTGAELAKNMAIPESIAVPVVQTFRATLKKRHTMRFKGFDGLPHPKDGAKFDWFHEYRFGSGGMAVDRLNLKGSKSLQLGDPVLPGASGHPLMQGRKATLRSLRPITFVIEGQELTFAMMMHRPLPMNGLLKQWRLLYRNGEYWVNFMLEIPPYVEASPDAGGVAGFDLNWRVLPSGGILVGVLTDGNEDTMIVIDMGRSAHATDEGGMIDTLSEGGFRVVSVGVGPSRWGRNNLCKGVNYGVPDTFAGAFQLSVIRDKAKDNLKNRIKRTLGDETPSYLALCGTRGLKQLAREFDSTHPEVSAEIQEWAILDDDLLRVTRKLTKQLDSRLKRAYEQLAHHLCRKLSQVGIRRIAIEENFLKRIAEAEKKYQPVAVQRSARYRHSLGLAKMIGTLEHIAAKYGITLSRRKAAYTTSRCRFCAAICNFGAKRSAECPGCHLVIDQDQNAAHNLRNAELEERKSVGGEPNEQDSNERTYSWTLAIGRLSPEGEVRQRRILLLTAKVRNG